MQDCFTLSFHPSITLSIEPAQIQVQSPQHTLTLTHPKPGLRAAMEQLQQSNWTATQLTAVVTEQDGEAEGIHFAAELDKLVELGWICHAVMPLAIALPVAQPYHLQSPELDGRSLTLSRFAFLHPEGQHLVLESPLSKSKITLLDWRVAGVIAQLSFAGVAWSVEALEELGLDAEVVQRLLGLLIATGMIGLEEDSTITQWKFHNLLFHRQTRLERLENKHKQTPTFQERDRYPAVKPPMSDHAIALSKPDIATLIKADIPLTQAIETRQSIREYDEQPICLAQLAEFLYRCARVKQVYSVEDHWGSDPMQIGETTRRPYPSGGALYELEIYPVVHRCDGLAAGLYHYQPLSHTLHLVTEWHPPVEVLIFDAWKSTGQQDLPQVVFIITARFGRLFWKYHDIAYGLILKHVGVLYQTFYLVATAMQLAPSAIGASNSQQFCSVVGLNQYEESSVGEFSLGSLKHPMAPPP